MPSVPPLKQLRPIHLHVIALHLRGVTNVEIAAQLDYTHIRVSQILNDPLALEVIEQMRERIVINTEEEVMNKLQMIAPELIDKKISLALTSKDERVATINSAELLQMAGHTPVKRIHVQRNDELERKYDKMTDDDIVKQIESGLFGEAKGPDDKLLN